MLRRSVLKGKMRINVSKLNMHKSHFDVKVSVAHQMKLSPITFSAVEHRYFLCGVQTHFILGHLQVVLKRVNTADVKPQIALKNTDNKKHEIYSIHAYIL